MKLSTSLGKSVVVAVLALCCAALVAVRAEESVGGAQKTESSAAAKAPTAAPSEAAPAPVDAPYVAPYDNGLYTTIAGYNSLKPCKCFHLQPMTIQPANFAKEVTVHVIIQPNPAPLVVLLLGAEGKALDPLGRQWAGWLDEAGCHVLTFNSTLASDFVTSSGRGVSGCIRNEAECVRDVIASYIKSPELEGKVTKIGLVGISYGSIESLMIDKMSTEKDAPFKIDAVRAFSPPLDMLYAGETIDKWWREDRWNYSLPQLYLIVGKHKPVEPGSPIPLSDSMLRAALAASFRLDLAEVVDRNDSHYHLHVLPVGGGISEDQLRNDYAFTYGFSRFLREFTFPYWKDKLNIGSVEELNADAKLVNLLPQIPANAEVVIADDDPLNDPAELENVKKLKLNCHLNILRGGGHAGYISACWTRTKLLSIFKN